MADRVSIETLRTVRLYGVLGKKFGKEFKLDVRSPAEAVRALCAVIKGFREHLVKFQTQHYHLRVGREFRGEDDLNKPCAMTEIIKLIPATAGSGRLVRVIVGIVLIIVGAVINYYTGGTGGNWAIGLGVAMLAGGIADYLSPKPKSEGSDSALNRPSKYFNGVQNPLAQGNPIPVGYGKLRFGVYPIDIQLWAQEVLLTEEI